jgi:hypothetical protein
MKKIFSIITIITALFLILSCGASLHNADVMHVEKVVVEGLTDLAGKEMVISGNWIPNKDGTGFWAHGLGDTSNILDGAIATVDGDGTVVFNIDVITSEAELEFLGKVNEAGWNDAKRFGAKAYAEGNAKIANLFTGSGTPKVVHGVVQADNSIDWRIVDAIAENRVVIDEVVVIGLPVAYQGEFVEFSGFAGTAVAAPVGKVDADGVLSISFLSPITLRSDNVEFSLAVVGSPAQRIASEIDAAADDVASIANPASGPNTVLKIYGLVQLDGSIVWSIIPPALKQIVGWEIVGGVANRSYTMNGSMFGWSLPWDSTSPIVITTDDTGAGSHIFAEPYAASTGDEFTGAILVADGSDMGWGEDRFVPDGSPNVQINQMSGYDAADWAASNLNAIDFTLRLTSTAVNTWTWELVEN